MKLKHHEQEKFFRAGKTLKSLKDGVSKRILSGDPSRGIRSCLGFINPNGIAFYGASYFPEDEELELLDEA